MEPMEPDQPEQPDEPEQLRLFDQDTGEPYPDGPDTDPRSPEGSPEPEPS